MRESFDDWKRRMGINLPREQAIRMYQRWMDDWHIRCRRLDRINGQIAKDAITAVMMIAISLIIVGAVFLLRVVGGDGVS